MKAQDAKIVFFGSSQMSVMALEELLAVGIIPAVIVTSPDAKAGRGRVLTAPPVKLWAEKEDIEILQPSKLDNDFIIELSNTDWDAFIVFAYGKILPQTLLDVPRRGTLNIHPSMLPLLRGPSPVRSAIARDERDSVGISIIELDAKMDHGPIVAQASVELSEWPMSGNILDEMLAREGGKLLAEAMPTWLSGDLIPEEQEHSAATFCHFLSKSDGEILESDTDYEKYLKYCAYDGWPGTFFFSRAGSEQVRKRIKITKAHLNQDGKFIINRVIPEGKSEVNWTA